MQYFTSNYEKVKKSARQRKNRQHKQNERQRKLGADEEAYKKAMAAEKQKQRREERERDEETHKKARAAEKQKERTKEREIDEEAHKRARAAEKQKQRTKERELDEEAHKRARAEEQKRQRDISNRKVDEQTRRRNYFRSVIFGPIFICSCCERTFFEKGVTKITEDFKEKLAKKKVPYSTVIPPKQEVQINIELDGDTSLSGIYICLTCKNTLLGGKMPAMAVQNGLHLPHVPEDYQLTELENNLIAQMLNFQYIYRLPKSRWGATKKRMISVPVTRETVSETLSQLPRLPKDAGLIPLVPANLKRKMEYKNTHKTEYIDPEKVLKVVKYLKDSGHPFYQFCDDLNLDTYKERCKEQDQRGFELLFSEDEDKNEKSKEIPPNNENGGMPKIYTESNLDEEQEEIYEEDNTQSKI